MPQNIFPTFTNELDGPARCSAVEEDVLHPCGKPPVITLVARRKGLTGYACVEHLQLALDKQEHWTFRALNPQ